MAPMWRFDTLITAVTACLCLSQAQAASLVGRQDSTSCKAIPGDDQWPSQVKWNQLNETVGGRLIATEPKAAVCHPNGYGSIQYNATVCTALKAVWDKPAIQSVVSCSLCSHTCCHSQMLTAASASKRAVRGRNYESILRQCILQPILQYKWDM